MSNRSLPVPNGLNSGERAILDLFDGGEHRIDVIAGITGLSRERVRKTVTYYGVHPALEQRRFEAQAREGSRRLAEACNALRARSA